MKLNAIGVIPARYGSSRFPGKPLANIKGKPMIQWVYEHAKQALENVYVATDDDKIAEAVVSFGGEVIMTDPNHQSGTDRIAEAVTKIISTSNIKIDIVVNIQGDEPFIQPSQIQSVIECFDSKEVDIATLIKRIEEDAILHNPNSPKVVVGIDGRALYFSRSPIPYFRNIEAGEWHTKHTYYKHIGIYAYRVDKLFEITNLPQSPLEVVESLEQLRWLENGYTIKTAITDFEGLAVDTPEDLQKLLKSID